MRRLHRLPAALALVAVTTTGCGGGTTRPATPPPTATASAPAPVGPPPAPTRVAWWAHGVLHAGGATYRVPRPRDLVYRSGTTLVEGRRDDLVTRDGGPLRRLPGHPRSPYSLTLSADGREVAWSSVVRDVQLPSQDAYEDGPSRETALTEVATVVGRRVLGRLWVTGVEHCCDLTGIPLLESVTRRDGVLLWIPRVDGQGEDDVWRPGGRRVRLPDVHGREPEVDGIAAWPRGVAVEVPGLPGQEDDEAVAPLVQGRLGRRVGRVQDPQEGQWNVDGTLFASTNDASEPTVQRLGRTAATLPTGLPAEPGTELVAWESRTVALFDDARGLVVRCDVLRQACTRVPGIPSRHVVLPDGTDDV